MIGLTKEAIVNLLEKNDLAVARALAVKSPMSEAWWMMAGGMGLECAIVPSLINPLVVHLSGMPARMETGATLVCIVLLEACLHRART